MTDVTGFSYHSTNQLRNVVKTIVTQARFKGLDEDNQPILDLTAEIPVISYTGTVKLHGTNASIIAHEDGMVSFHSKNNMLGHVVKGDFTLLSDNSGFAQTMYRRWSGVDRMISRACAISIHVHGKVVYPLKISGEWCGQGIQSRVGISFLPSKSFFVFGLKIGETNQQNKTGWVPAELTNILHFEDHHMYSIANFPTYKVVIDFNEPEMIQQKLIDATLAVEECCPVSKQLGITESLLGEGLVWTPDEESLCWDTGTWFKTKGKKHSVSKVKTLVAVCPEKLSSIKEFVEYAVTEARLEQALGEVGLDQKSIGKFIGWMNKDINKEEGDVLEANNLSMKEVGKKVSDKCRKFYLEKLNGL